jgi:hypothetical protein
MPAGSLGRLRDRSAAALALAVFRTGLPALKQAAGTADVPLPIVLLVIPVTLLLAGLLAAGPGWAAARIRPAGALRAE